MAFKPVDMSRFRVLDLSQNFSVDSPPFAYYEGPTIKWVKKMAFEGVNAQLISSTNHIATHLDSPLHFNDPGPDVAGIPLDELLGPACVVDLAQFGVGDYDIYGPKHFDLWERKYKIRIQRGDILVIHTGYHHYYNEDWYKVRNKEKPNLPRAFLKHPGPQVEFCDWVLQRGIRWMAIDKAFPWPKAYQATHTYLFPKGVFHVENVGGMIDEVLNTRVWFGAFPFRFKGGEAAFCRCFAFVRK